MYLPTFPHHWEVALLPYLHAQSDVLGEVKSRDEKGNCLVLLSWCLLVKLLTAKFPVYAWWERNSIQKRENLTYFSTILSYIPELKQLSWEMSFLYPLS